MEGHTFIFHPSPSLPLMEGHTFIKKGTPLIELEHFAAAIDEEIAALSMTRLERLGECENGWNGRKA